MQTGVKKKVSSKNNNDILSIPITKWKLYKKDHCLLKWKLKISKSECIFKFELIIQKHKTNKNWNNEKNNDVFFISFVFSIILFMEKEKNNRANSQAKKEKNSR